MIGDGDGEAIFENGDFDTAATFYTDEFIPPTELSVNGWFTEATEEVNIMTGKVEAVDPKFDCATPALATIVRSQGCVINGTDYKIERIQRTGIGISTVHLKT